MTITTDPTPFATIVDLFDSDAPGCRREALRLARDTGHHLELRALLDARRDADRREQAVRDEIRTFEARQRLSTPWLEDMADDATNPQARQARILLMLPTIDQRQAARGGAHRYMNATPDAGRYSDALLSVVHSMLAGYPA
jgi:hypothetical protein